MKPEVVHGEKKDIQPRVQARGGQSGRRACVSVAQAAKDLDVHENLLRKWVRELRQELQDAFPGHGKQNAQDAEIARLRKEVTKLNMERDILKKAATC